MRKQLLFIALLILSQINYGQNAADIDASFSTGIGFNNDVNTITTQSDGKILIGGSFTTYQGVSANRIIRLNKDGSIDNTFIYGTGFDNPVKEILVQPDDKILIVGLFSTYKSGVASRLIRLNSNGSVDNTFSSIGSSTAYNINNIVIQSDSKLLVSREFSGSVFDIVRLNTNGSLDNTFSTGSGFESYINSIEIQQDGIIYVAGGFLTYKGVNLTTRRIVRLNTDGTRDITFSSGGTGYNAEVLDIAIRTDGKIVAVGNFSQYSFYSGTSHINLIETTGAAPGSFGYNGFDAFGPVVRSVAIQNDGKVLVGGNFLQYGGVPTTRIVRLESNGIIDGTFTFFSGSGFNSDVKKIYLQQDGKILIGGYFTTYNGVTANRIVRLKGSPVLSTDKFDENEFAIYPNPVEDILNINLPKQDSALEYSIYDVSGKKVTSNKLLENKIDVRSLSKGIYIVKIKTSEKIFENKFIKQ